MSDSKNKPVHPMQWRNEGHYGETWYDQEFGMTIRQHYAGLAMQALLARQYPDHGVLARQAVQAADALIAELEKTEQ